MIYAEVLVYVYVPVTIYAMNLVADVDDAIEETKGEVLTIVGPAINKNERLYLCYS